MLIGAHVSTAGGLAKAVERGEDLTCDAIQIFHQSPRMWKPTAYDEADFAAAREALAGSRVESVTIHAVYLINCASREADIRRKSLASLEQALAVGDGIGADGVVLHAGARKGEPYAASVKRAGTLIREALARTDRCPLLLENTAGTQGPLGRDFGELADLLEAGGGDARLGACLDCCHLLAAGFEIRTQESLAEVVDEFSRLVGLARLHCAHVNDSKVDLGANRDLHANLGKGALGRRGIRVFLSEPRFEDLPALIETGGEEGKAPNRADVTLARRLRREGIKARRGDAKKGG